MRQLLWLLFRLWLGCLYCVVQSTSKDTRPWFSDRFGVPWWKHNRDKREAPQCPCVKLAGGPSSASCLSFDSQLLAASLEEAILNFPNLLTQNHPDADPKTLRPGRSRSQIKAGDTVLVCSDDVCRNCMKLYLAYFRKQTEVQTETEAQKKTLAEIDELYSRFSLASINATAKDCDWLTVRKSRVDKTSNETVDVSDEQLEQIMKVIRGDDKPGPKKPAKAFVDGSSTGIRTKREYLDPAFENSYVLETRYRGEPLSDDVSWRGMCNLHWKWGRLSKNYFPRYVNMLACDSDNRCLSEFGKCFERTRSVTVVQNMGPSKDEPRWQPYSLSVPVACDCQVYPDSALTNLVRS